MKGEAALRDRFPNPPVRPTVQVDDLDAGKARRLIESNQEDIDLVIATERDLVLIEAKAYGNFGNAQIKSKLDRLNLLHDFYQKLKSESDHAVCFHVLLISSQKPRRLNACWPGWACKDSEVPWIKLPLNESILQVMRCDEDGHSSVLGDFWRVIEPGRRSRQDRRKPGIGN
jgi:hypothetical protein